jgi:hypothetical protein
MHALAPLLPTAIARHRSAHCRTRINIDASHSNRAANRYLNERIEHEPGRYQADCADKGGIYEKTSGFVD